jgi:hypothetical protein
MSENHQQYLTEKQYSELSGLSLSHIRNQRWARKGASFVKIGKSVRYLYSDCISYLETNRIETEDSR